LLAQLLDHLFQNSWLRLLLINPTSALNFLHIEFFYNFSCLILKLLKLSKNVHMKLIFFNLLLKFTIKIILFKHVWNSFCRFFIFYKNCSDENFLQVSFIELIHFVRIRSVGATKVTSSKTGEFPLLLL